MLRCPICKKQIPPAASNPKAPFCSERCRLLDLGNWLGGTYAVPGRPEDDESPSSEPSTESRPELPGPGSTRH